jgi:hypothetical protein
MVLLLAVVQVENQNILVSKCRVLVWQLCMVELWLESKLLCRELIESVMLNCVSCEQT